MELSFLPWWGWLLAAAALFLAIQFTDDDNRTARALLFVAMVFSALVGIIRFVKWVWSS